MNTNKDPCCSQWECKCRTVNGECKVCKEKLKRELEQAMVQQIANAASMM